MALSPDAPAPPVSPLFRAPGVPIVPSSRFRERVSVYQDSGSQTVEVEELYLDMDALTSAEFSPNRYEPPSPTVSKIIPS
ncbi:MAG TPA: hypothetical protein ENI15_04795 [Spirochaetes bacterium]|nr:hypothetical protein [Spirochaetota bacterium]